MNLSGRTKLRIYNYVAAIILLTGLLLTLATSNATLISIGTSLVASGIVVTLEIVHRMLIRDEAGRLDALLTSGLEAVYNRRDLERYHELVPLAASRVDVTGYSLRNFHESFKAILGDRLRARPDLRLRLLFVNPESHHSIERERAERVAPGTFRRSFEEVVSTFRDQGNVEIRTIAGSLTTVVFRIDNRMFVGPQFMSAASKATVTFEILQAADTWLFTTYEKEFNAMWASAERV